METDQLNRIYKKLQKYFIDPAEIFLVQSIESQKLMVCKKDTIIRQYKSSTSRFGNSNRENSFKTPIGVHRIREKIGANAPVGRIFKERCDTGIDWNNNFIEDNLILTRILRLEGLEEGINKGSGVDSYERCIYVHGTNQEDLVGLPLSHGCLALQNQDIISLFNIVSEGTILYIDPLPLVINKKKCRSIHFTGIFGTGMSALAQYLRFQGIDVSGSDRLLASEDIVSIQQSLAKLGCNIVNQDGSGVTMDAVCISTAIEESNPDIAAAHACNIPIIHRSDLLAAIMKSKKTIAIAGTSGKSTVTAMIFEFLSACGKSPSLISGAPLRRLEKEGLIGNAFSGSSDLLVVEADESDGTLVKYAPDVAIVLNISKDHKDINEIKELFETLILNSQWTVSNAEDPILKTIPANMYFGKSKPALWFPDNEKLMPSSVKLIRNNIEYHLPFPGSHNLENLRAALCVCEHFDCDGPTLADAVKNFQGVARRFAINNTEQNVYVIDDFAHNPAKIAAAVSAARGLSDRIVAVYQPHGFGPTRFLKNEYIATFKNILYQNDRLYLLPIYYAGGTACKDISSEDIIKELGPVLFHAQIVKDRKELLTELKENVRTGNCILVMGARDPSLSALVKKIVELFQ